MHHLLLATLLSSLLTLSSAQFGFFEQMFGQQDDDHHGHHHHQRSNNPSDASLYHEYYKASTCDKYLCPDSLACVDVPLHCPCIWAGHEEKFEFGHDNFRLCLSRSGHRDGETGLKVQLARRGLL